MATVTITLTVPDVQWADALAQFGGDPTAWLAEQAQGHVAQLSQGHLATSAALVGLTGDLSGLSRDEVLSLIASRTLAKAQKAAAASASPATA